MRNLVAYLVRHGATVNTKDKLGRTPIFVAMSARVLKTMLAHGALLNITDQLRFTPLDAAIFYSPDRRLPLLLAAGANPNAIDAKGETPLYFAVSHSRLAAAKLLIHYGAQVNTPDRAGNTPLHVAARNRRLDIARLLLKHGANVNAKGWDGWTPLEDAAAANDSAMVNLLLAHHAEVNTRDHVGLTAWRRATSSDVRVILAAHAAIVDPPSMRRDDARTCQEIVRLANRGTLARIYTAETAPQGVQMAQNPWDDWDYYRYANPRLVTLDGKKYVLGENVGPGYAPEYLARISADHVEQIICEFGASSSVKSSSRILTPFERLKLHAGDAHVRLSEETTKWPGLGGARALINFLRHRTEPITSGQDSETTILNDAINAHRTDLLVYYLKQ